MRASTILNRHFMIGHKGIAHTNWMTTFRASSKKGSDNKVLSRSFRLGEKSDKWPKAMSCLSEYALKFNLVHFDTILRNVTVCTDLVAPG